VSARQWGTVVYDIDADDVITHTGGEWVEFALANDAPELAHGAVGRSMWDFIAGPVTRQIYRDLLMRVRSGEEVAFTFRCDAPTVFRLMTMTIRALANGRVRFESTLQAWGERRLSATVTIPRFVRICDWCSRICVDSVWRQPEFAMSRLDMLQVDDLSRITHGVCPTCAAFLQPRPPRETRS
jgi:hypothetical protein